MANIDLLNQKLQAHFNTMTSAGEEPLFVVALDKDELWNLYLDSFPAGTNPIYRVRREYDCSCCRNFIKAMGNVVWIDSNYNIRTLFEFDAGSDIFQPVLDTLDRFVKRHRIDHVYHSKLDHAGCRKSHELSKDDGLVIEWNHLFLDIPKKYVYTRSIPTLDTVISDETTSHNVFRRSLDEITDDAVDTVIELIDSNTLYRGEEFASLIKTFKRYKDSYNDLGYDTAKKDNFAWKNSSVAGPFVSRIRNHAIGTLLTDISEGIELDTAVRRYEGIMAPSNYKRPKPIYTKKMLEAAEKTVTELGYIDSLPRRFATLDDIRINNILFANRDAGKRINGGGIFDSMKEEADVVNPKVFSRVEQIPIKDFIEKVLPHANEIDLLLENRLERNMVSLIAPVNADSKSMFKWNNGFSWAYSGNMTDSDIRQNVKAAGGKIDGFMRFSIQWNDDGEHDQNDLDAHCKETLDKGYDISTAHIYYRNKHSFLTGGELDVDIIDPDFGRAAVENIVYPSKDNVPHGSYEFFVHCYSYRGGRSGFRAELEVNGEIFTFDYRKPLRQDEVVNVATVNADPDSGKYIITKHINDVLTSKDIWGIKSNKFVPVSVIMYSPNYWDEQTGVGNRHYMFMLKGCVNPEKPNGFYNEFVKNELNEHRKVFEALGSRMSVQDTDDQLSGVGFSSTKENYAIVRVKGATTRVIKIIF